MINKNIKYYHYLSSFNALIPRRKGVTDTGGKLVGNCREIGGKSARNWKEIGEKLVGNSGSSAGSWWEH